MQVEIIISTLVISVYVLFIIRNLMNWSSESLLRAKQTELTKSTTLEKCTGWETVRARLGLLFTKVFCCVAMVILPNLLLWNQSRRSWATLGIPSFLLRVPCVKSQLLIRVSWSLKVKRVYFFWDLFSTLLRRNLGESSDGFAPQGSRDWSSHASVLWPYFNRSTIIIVWSGSGFQL